jgi:hypothetical protein
MIQYINQDMYKYFVFDLLMHQYIQYFIIVKELMP